MSLIHVLTVDSIVPILRVNKEDRIWSTKSEPIEITTYDSKLNVLFQEIERHQTAEDFFEEMQNEEGLDWLEKNKIQGEFGEKLALQYLQSQYTHVESVSHIASKGYDIEVKSEDEILGFEVKTSRSVNSFYITYNELQKAYSMTDRYYLFFIFMEQLVNEVYSYGFIIKNPIQALSLDFLKLTEPLHTGKAEIIPHHFRVSMDKDFLESFDVIII